MPVTTESGGEPSVGGVLEEEKKVDAESTSDSLKSGPIIACHIDMISTQPSDEYDSRASVDPEYVSTSQVALNQAASTTTEAADITRMRSDDVLKLGSTEEVLASANTVLQKMKRGQRLKHDLDINFPNIPETPSENTIGSTDEYENAVKKLTSRLKQPESSQSRDTMLRRVDGMVPPKISDFFPDEIIEKEKDGNARAVLFAEEEKPPQSTAGNSATKAEATSIEVIEPVVVRSLIAKEQPEGTSYASWFKYFNDMRIGSVVGTTEVEEGRQTDAAREEVLLPPMAKSLVKVAFNSIVDAMAIDPRMPYWIEKQSSEREAPSPDGTYALGESRTVIVHEIMRDGWTWSTAWSPNGDRLAIGTENHHLTVIDTTSSSVWRVRHDQRVTGPRPKGTNSIRSIAWGSQFIAIGGTGDLVSIVAPTEPYPILHMIPAGTYVGSLDWRSSGKTLIIGSREGKVLIVKIGTLDDNDDSAGNAAIHSKILHTIDRKQSWVNAVKFSPDGSAFAVGDDEGIVGVYSYSEGQGTDVTVSNVANFKMEDAILDVEWSPDGKWLYAGGEDFAVTIIKAEGWEAVHRIKRKKWVQFLASSCGGSHIAVGGVSSEVSILDVKSGWKTATNVSLKGMNPLSARWHPKDQYLVLTGQNNSILAVETTNARYVRGHFLRSISPILCIEFSPDGGMAVIGNKAGVITIYMLTGTTFTTIYEMVLDCLGSLSMKWSKNGAFLAISTENKIVILSRRAPELQGGAAPPNTSGFSVAKVARNLGNVRSIAIDPKSRFIAVCGLQTRILDAASNFTEVCYIGNASSSGRSLAGASIFANVLDMANSVRALSMAGSWSADGNWFALVGRNQNLVFYDTSSDSPSEWQRLFDVQAEQAGLALAWGPPTETGLQYCAYGGEERTVCILEIRNKERSWEKVLEVPRDGVVYDLDWNNDGLVAAAVSNGTVTVMDLSYLQSGWAVNEMDYNWQRQALTCFTEIQRNRGKNCMQTVRWIPSAPGSDNLLAIGGTDGEVEIVDLTARYRCRGFSNEPSPKIQSDS
jgi:WD40 repeat protein